MRTFHHFRDRRRSNRRRAAASVNRLRVEQLEERTLLAGLVAHWSADNTSADSVGSSDGTLVSGATYAAGQVGQAYSFDGIDDRVQVPDVDALKLTQSMTIEAWVQADSFPSGAPHDHGEILFRGDDRGGLDPYSLSTEPDGTIRFQITSHSGGQSLSAPMPLGQFVHVVATLDDATGNMRLYLNGVLVRQAVTEHRPFRDLDPNSNPGIGIGNHGGYPNTPHNFPFDGRIDELRVYDLALTPEEVLAHFDAEKGHLRPMISIGDTAAVEGEEAIQYLGTFLAAADGLNDPWQAIHGPDGALYVSSLNGSSVLRYDATTGVALPAPGKPGAEFVTPGSGGLSRARGIAFGPDGNLYAASSDTDAILRFDAATGDFLGEFVTSGSGGLDGPRGILFHTDGYLYVTSVLTSNSPAAAVGDAILRFDALTGAPAGISGVADDAVFVASGSGGLDNPSMITSHGGEFYVSSTSPGTSNSVLRYGADGGFLGAFVPSGSGGLSGPVDLRFRDGSLFVTSWQNGKVLQYDGTKGDFIAEVVSEGLDRPAGLLFEPDGNFLVSSGNGDEIRRYGSAPPQAVFHVRLSAPFPWTTSVDYGTDNGTALAGDDYQTVTGTVTFLPGESSKYIPVPIIDDNVPELPESFAVNLTNSVGATIVDAHGVATIIDDDAITLFSDSFENGQWSGLWNQDNQNAWFISTQRQTEGSYSAEVDGKASNATLTTATPLDLTSYASVELSFDWLIESSLDRGEYLAMDLFDGANWQEAAILRGNVDAEDVWRRQTVALDSSFLVSNFQFRFRATMNRSDEDANVDNVRLLATSLAGPPNRLPLAAGDTAVTPEDVAVIIDVLANDTDPDVGDVLRVDAVTQGNHGTVAINAGQTLTYTPRADFHGTDSFTYTLSGGRGGLDTATVSVTVTSVNDAPVASADSYGTEPDVPLAVAVPGLLTNDSDVDGDLVTVVVPELGNVNTAQGGQVTLNSDGSFTYTPPAGFSGTDTFEYAITDGALQSVPVTVSIEVAAASTDTALYVYDIRFESKRGGNDWRAVFEIRSDSNGDGQGGAADDVAVGVEITVEFAGQTYTGTTDANGIFRTSWIRNPGSGSYAEVVDLALIGHAWNPLSLDLEDDADGDGLPDNVLY